MARQRKTAALVKRLLLFLRPSRATRLGRADFVRLLTSVAPSLNV